MSKCEWGRAELSAIQAAWPLVTDFERDFPSLCFALATGVGKTRLMGAFIAYLYLSGRSRCFFVLAPNTTIYDKVIGVFTPNSEKYVFRGIAEFAQISLIFTNFREYPDEIWRCLPRIIRLPTYSGFLFLIEAVEISPSPCNSFFSSFAVRGPHYFSQLFH
jgi:hypothetical protein